MDHGISSQSLLILALIFRFITSAYCDCDVPPSISYGFLKEEFANQKTFDPGETVQYICRPGYIRILGMKNTVTCMKNSKWTSLAQFCTERSCGNPGDIENGYFEAPHVLFGAEVKYYCNEGYAMISSRHNRFCQADGTWSNTVPVCEAVICPSPAPIPNGIFYPEKDEYNFLDTIHYQCNSPKHALSGETFASCTAKGTWSSNPPKCIDVQCPLPDVSNARKVSGFAGPYSINALVRFECLEGFAMIGSSDVICNIHSQWEPSLPTCNRNFCYMPDLINGSIKKGKPKSFNHEKGFHIKDSVTMTCDSSFEIKGESTITCGEDLNWLPALPICEKKNFCSMPHLINGSIKKGKPKSFNNENGFHIKDSVTMTCDSSFTIYGASTITCGEDLNWLPALPICEKTLGCSSPRILNGRVAHKNGKSYDAEKDGHAFTTSDTIEVQCNEGFTLTGSSSTKCKLTWSLSPYQWSPALPICERW